MKITLNNEDGTSEVLNLPEAMQQLHERVTTCEAVLLAHQIMHESKEEIEKE